MQTPAPRPPRVSVAIPVYNGAHWIAQTVRSALEQSFEDLEVVVVDNASTDDTVDIVREVADGRVRVFRNETNLGPYVNQNHSIRFSRGELVKFLHADDYLLPPCVERMVDALDAYPSAGMVFSRRQIDLSPQAHPDWQEWPKRYGELHRHFARVEALNDGRALLREFIGADFPENWIAEPTSVMARRSVLDDVGGFSEHVLQLNDIELWTRIMGRYDVAFVDEELAVARIGSGASLTTDNRTAGRNWLDRLWMLESIRAVPGVAAAVPELGERLPAERREALRALARTARRNRSLLAEKAREFAGYARYRAAERAGRPRSLHPDVRAFTAPSAPDLAAVRDSGADPVSG